jgi:hypothetical protein
MSRYRAIYDGQGLVAEIQDGEVIFMREDDNPSEKAGYHIIPDIQPYKNMIDGRMITSRSEHRELLKRHGCIEIGNEKMETKPIQAQSSRRESIARRLGDMSDRDANRILSDLRRS